MNTMAEFKSTYDYSPHLVRKAFLAFFWRRCLPHILITPFVLYACIKNFFSPEFGVISGIGIGILLAFWSSWLGAYRRSASTASPAVAQKIEVSFSSNGLSFNSSEVTSTVKWSAIECTYTTPEFLIVLRKGILNPVPIPISALPENALPFFLARVKEAGGSNR